ncbi:hypothetical protein LAZ67_2003545 [Cordylochernes scorpioides]|uniref:Uncharacterized protein n=1 Tax=Cordylochernes scorpioides TaxID=51811 RepID=A0ABY6K3R8_9ARAC|nr:hypothetical protein LAZ67_2003545 [Cordylochernes scorpioides]
MFSEGREDVNDEERAGRPSTSTTDEKINEVEKMILGNRRITVREVAEDLNISIGSCHSIFINDLGMRRVAAKFVQKLLNCDQKQHRMNIANEMLDSVRDDPNLLQRVITGDEAGVVHHEFLPQGRTDSYVEKTTLHIFCDASQFAYATCIFIRIEKEDRVDIQLIQARTREAPLKKLTIPRLELLACLIGTCLAANVIQDLEFEEIPRFYWTDSTNALCWIQREDNWAAFVMNHVKEIHNLSSPESWRHIPGRLNPADLPSRGCSAETLKETKWWEGPAWLKLSQEKWPKSTIIPDLEIIYSERRKTILNTLCIVLVKDDFFSLQDRLLLVNFDIQLVNSGRGMAESMVVEGVLLWRGDRSWADLVLGEVGGSFISVVGDHFFRVTVQRLARKGVRARSKVATVENLEGNPREMVVAGPAVRRAAVLCRIQSPNCLQGPEVLSDGPQEPLGMS